MTSNSAVLPIELFHKTCLNMAMKVCETKIWKFSDSGGDRGINLFDGRKDFTGGNQIPHTGAHLIFSWLGKPALKVAPGPIPLIGKDILYDQHPWRMFVGSDLSPDLMQLVRIDLIDPTGQCDKCGDHSHVGLIDRLMPSKRPAALKQLVERTNQRLLLKKIFIEKTTKIVDFIP